MADNVLSGIVRITAPGVEATFTAIAAGAKKTESSLAGVIPAANQATKAISNVAAPSIKTGDALHDLAVNINNIDTSSQLTAALQRINASIDATAAAALKATGPLSALQRQVAVFGGGVASFVPALGKVPAVLNQLPASINRATGALSRLPTSSNAATGSLINLGRVVQDAPFGFLGIANNLNPLLESFQRLKQSTGTTGGALKALGRSLTGAGGIGLALSVVSSALIVFGDKLFSTSSGFSSATLFAAKFEAALSSLGESADKLKSKLDFEKELSTLSAQLAGLKGPRLDISNLQEDIRAAIEISKDAAGKIEDLQKARNPFEFFRKGILETGKATDAMGFRMSKLAQILNTFPDVTKVPTGLIEKLNAKEQAQFSQYVDLLKALKVEEKRFADAQKILVLAPGNIAKLGGEVLKEQQEENKRIQDKADSDYAAYVSKTIARGKELASFFEGRRVVPTFTIFDSQKEQLDKAQKIIDDFAKGAQKIIFRPQVEIQPQFSIERGFVPKEILPTSRFKNLFEEIDTSKIELKLPVEFSAEVIANAANRQKMIDAAKSLSDSFNNAIQQGFENGFAALGEGLGNILSGKNFGTQLFEVIGSLLEQVGKALIKFGIVKTGIDKILANPLIPGGIAIGLGIFAIAAGKLLKNISGAREKGGPVSAGKTYLVGEKGPELFTPKQGGKIINNAKTEKLIASSNKITNNSTASSKSFYTTKNIEGKRVDGGSVQNNKTYLVGEKGPELFTAKEPGKIIANSKTEKILAGAKNISKTISNNKSISKIFNTTFGGFKQLGGSVSTGLNYIVGDGGRELFVPNTGRSIQINNEYNNMGTSSPGGLRVEVVGKTVIQGMDLVQILTIANQSKARLQ